MTTFLYRLGRAVYHRKGTVIAVWLLIFLAFVVGGFGFGGKLSDSFSIPGTESQTALDRLDAVFPQSAGASAQVLLVAPKGERVDTAANKAVVERTVTRIKGITGVEAVADPFGEYATAAVSRDGAAAIIQVQFKANGTAVPTATSNAVLDAKSIGQAAGFTVTVSGDPYQTVNVGVSPTEGVGVLFAGLVLFITFGSLLSAGLPLLTAVLGVVVGFAAIRIAAIFTTVSTTAPRLALMLGLAVGIDYALFILSRHREQLATGMEVGESIATAVATAGTAVAFAGSTVIIALLGLLVVNIPFLSIMGVGAAFAVLVAVVGSITLLPALLALGGTRFAPKPGSKAARRAIEVRGEGQADPKTMGAAWVRGVQRVPWLASLLVVLLLGAVAIPATTLELSLPNAGRDPVGSSTRVAYDLTTKHFGEGRNGPLILLFDITQNNSFLADLNTVRDRIKKLPDVQAVGKPTPNESLDTAIMQVIPKSGPESASTIALVKQLRSLESTFTKQYELPMSVTGTTAVRIDISDRLGTAFLPFVLVVVGMSVLLLMMVFRSLLVPLKAAAGFLLSVGASLGVTVAVFQWGWGSSALDVEAGPLLSFLPILVVAILFGLSMDYEVFLVSGMRESWVHGGDARRAVRRGFAHGARVVTAAALIMFFVFASFVPEGSGTIKPIALALATGIAFDAFLVRMTLVPALMTIFGRAGWYLPKWLERVLPDIDIEGVGIVRQRADQAWAAGQTAWVLSADGVQPSVPSDAPIIDLQVHAGSVDVLEVQHDAVRGVIATLSGHLHPIAGRLQVSGVTSPAESAALRERSAAIFDDGTAARATVGDLVRERLGALRRRDRRSAVRLWLDRIGASSTSGVVLEPTDALGSLTPDDRLAVLAAAALAGGSEVLLVDGADLGPEVGDRLVTKLERLVGRAGAAVLVVAPEPVTSVARPIAAEKKAVHS